MSRSPRSERPATPRRRRAADYTARVTGFASKDDTPGVDAPSPQYGPAPRIRLNVPGHYRGWLICRGDSDESRWYSQHSPWRWWLVAVSDWSVVGLAGALMLYSALERVLTRWEFGWVALAVAVGLQLLISAGVWLAGLPMYEPQDSADTPFCVGRGFVGRGRVVWVPDPVRPRHLGRVVRVGWSLKPTARRCYRVTLPDGRRLNFGPVPGDTRDADPDFELSDLRTGEVLCRTRPLGHDATCLTDESPDAAHLDDRLLAALLALTQ